MRVKAVVCSECGDKIFSRARHDFRTCSCDSTFIDGGFEYIRTNAPETVIVNVKATREQLYEDWNYSTDKYGLIKSKNKRSKERP